MNTHMVVVLVGSISVVMWLIGMVIFLSKREENRKEEMRNSLIGQPEINLINQLGIPTNKFALPDGRTAYVYLSSKSAVSAATTTGTGMSNGVPVVITGMTTVVNEAMTQLKWTIRDGVIEGWSEE